MLVLQVSMKRIIGLKGNINQAVIAGNQRLCCRRGGFQFSPVRLIEQAEVWFFLGAKADFTTEISWVTHNGPYGERKGDRRRRGKKKRAE